VDLVLRTGTHRFVTARCIASRKRRLCELWLWYLNLSAGHCVTQSADPFGNPRGVCLMMDRSHTLRRTSKWNKGKPRSKPLLLAGPTSSGISDHRRRSRVFRKLGSFLTFPWLLLWVMIYMGWVVLSLVREYNKITGAYKLKWQFYFK